MVRLIQLSGPSAVAASHVIVVYSQIYIDPSWLWRPLLVAIAAAAAITAIAVAVFRNVDRGSLVALSVVLLLGGGVIAGMTTMVLGAWLVYAYWRRIRRQPTPRVDRTILAVAPILLLSIVIVGAVGSIPNGAVASAANGRRDELANIYVLLLDGYPHPRTLIEHRLDDGLIADLEALDFEVADDSRSRFHQTRLALLSMLTAEIPAEDLDGPDLRMAYANAPILDEFREAGYHLIYLPSPVLRMVLDGWDETIVPAPMTELEYVLLQQTPLAPLFGDVVMANQRQYLIDTVENVTSTTRRTDQRLVFAHLIAPHPPFLYDETGRPRPAPDCWSARRCRLTATSAEGTGLDVPTYIERLGQQIELTNNYAIDMVSSIVADDPDAIVVVLSDHGGRITYDDLEEWHRSFYAVRGDVAEPEGPDGLLPRLLQAAKATRLGR